MIRQNVPEHGTGTYHDLVYGDISVDYKEIEMHVDALKDALDVVKEDLDYRLNN